MNATVVAALKALAEARKAYYASPSVTNNLTDLINCYEALEQALKDPAVDPPLPKPE
jgi:hypothetical protein